MMKKGESFIMEKLTGSWLDHFAAWGLIALIWKVIRDWTSKN